MIKVTEFRGTRASMGKQHWNRCALLSQKRGWDIRAAVVLMGHSWEGRQQRRASGVRTCLEGWLLGSQLEWLRQSVMIGPGLAVISLSFLRMKSCTKWRTSTGFSSGRQEKIGRARGKKSSSRFWSFFLNGRWMTISCNIIIDNAHWQYWSKQEHRNTKSRGWINIPP